MKSFSFQTTKSVLAEVGATAKIGDIMVSRGCTKIALVTDATIMKLGLADAALDGCKKAGLDILVISDVQPDPQEAMILISDNWPREYRPVCRPILTQILC